MCKVARSKLLAKSSASDINSAIDDVSHKMERQIKELKEKIKEKKFSRNIEM
ncbi:MAG: HPF/RaiA family ribosome-associated protein [bacterium]